MLTSNKVFWVGVIMYGLVVFVPATFLDSDLVPDRSIWTALAACALFLAGMGAGARLFKIPTSRLAPASSDEIQRGFEMLSVVLIGIAAYVALWGPQSPMIQAAISGDSFGAALAREDAVKLNPDKVFVRLYIIGRDMIAPVVVALAIAILTSNRPVRKRLLAVISIVAVLYIGLWSGQKATVVNYLVATFIFTQRDARGALRNIMIALPIGVGLIVFTFFVTQPELFARDQATSSILELFATSIVNRILTVPLEVAALYVHAVDDLHIIWPLDAAPTYSFIWAPLRQRIESTIGQEFFHQGIDSSHSNSLAFAYAYVLGGAVWSFIGGVLTLALLRLAAVIVDAGGSRFVSTAFNAYLCYLLLDLLNGNFLQYLITNILLALALWLLTRTVVLPILGGKPGAARSSTG